MVVLVALTVGLVIWTFAWGLGIKSFDAFLITVLLTVSAAGYRMVKPYLDKLLGRETEAEQMGPTGL